MGVTAQMMERTSFRKFSTYLALLLLVKGALVKDLYYTGDLCPPPHGNFTFSDLPIVKRKGQTDHVSVAWTNQVENSECVSWFYIKWWSLARSDKTGPIHGKTEKSFVLKGDVDKEDFVVQVVAVKEEKDHRGSYITRVFSAEVPVLRALGPIAATPVSPIVSLESRSAITVRWKKLNTPHVE